MAEREEINAETANNSERLLQMMTGYWISKAVYLAAKLGIADLLSRGPVHYEELARETGANAVSLYRTLRALASVGLFAEADAGQFTLTPMAALLRTGVPDSMRALGIMYGEEQYQAWGELLYSVNTGRPAFEHHFGTGVYEYFSQHPDASAVFNEAMTNWTTRVASVAANSYDFSPFRTVVDVGGNQGILLAAILRAHQGVRGILFDLPHVVATAPEYLASAGVESRCTIASGDVFTAVLPGGDAYVLSGVLHGFDDEHCVAILAQCRRVASDTGKLLILEHVIPDGDEPHLGKWLDLHMLVMSGGRERTREQYRALLQAGGFELTNIVPLAAGLSLVEAQPSMSKEPAHLRREVPN